MAATPTGLMDEAACGAIRELLNDHGVPSAAFIDDHVRNLIKQRDDARGAMRKAITIIDTNLYHQREKVEDASLILRSALEPE